MSIVFPLQPDCVLQDYASRVTHLRTPLPCLYIVLVLLRTAGFNRDVGKRTRNESGEEHGNVRTMTYLIDGKFTCDTAERMENRLVVKLGYSMKPSAYLLLDRPMANHSHLHRTRRDEVPMRA